MNTKLASLLICILAKSLIAAPIDLSTPSKWQHEIRELKLDETMAFISQHFDQWHQLRSPAFTERLTDQAAKTTIREGVALASEIISKVRDAVSIKAIDDSKQIERIVSMVALGDRIRASGGLTNEVLALVFERYARLSALLLIKNNAANAMKLSTVFIANPAAHIVPKAWLITHHSEDAQLQDKLPALEALGGETHIMQLMLKLGKLAGLSGVPDDRPLALIRTSNSGGLLVQSIISEFERTVALPLIIDFVAKGGQLSPRPADASNAVKEKLGNDMSRYRHLMTRQGNASPHDIWHILGQVTDEKFATDELNRWLQ